MAKIYQFGGYRLDPNAEILFRGAEPLALGQRAVALLCVLVERPGTPVSKDALIEAAWPGIAVEESNLTVQIAALRRVFSEDAGGERWIETLPRRGYRFIGPAVTTEDEGSPNVPVTMQPLSTLALPDKPSIAVLPFDNLSGDPEQEYFADGITEDITTALSQFRWLFVIARNSSFVFKGKKIDARQIARALGVRYVLEGSVRKGGNRVRITAQLVDAATNNHVWADRYDGDLTDIFALQDEITAKVAAAIEPKLLEAEGIRSQNRSPEDLGAWDMLMQANYLFWRLTKAEGQTAVAILRQVIERYPTYAPAHSMLAFMLLVSRQIGWIAMDPQVKEPAALAARAAELDDSDPWAHLALGWVALTRRRTDEAVEQFQRALELNPNFAAAHGYLGSALALDGRSDQAIDHIEQAVRMSPHDPQNALFNSNLAVAHYHAERYTEAVGCARKVVQQRFALTNGHRIYVACLAQAGQMEEARAALAQLQELHPENSIAWIERNVPYTPGPMAKFLEGMRKAGLQ